MNEELLKLEKRVMALKEWKNSITKERFKFPIDSETTKILKLDNLFFTGKTYVTSPIALTDQIAFGLIIGTNSSSKEKVAIAIQPITSFSVNTGSDSLTTTGDSIGIQNGDIIHFTYSDTLPSPLDEITDYYVVNKDGDTFQVSLTSGGAAIDIIDTGVGTYYYSKSSI